jgi:hypothetical protein
MLSLIQRLDKHNGKYVNSLNKYINDFQEWITKMDKDSNVINQGLV